MQKVLGQDIKDLEERKQFLIDNADKVVETDYHKSFTADELATMKTEFAEKHIRIATLEEKIKDFKDEVNVELKPLKEEVAEIRENLKSKGKHAVLELISPDAEAIVEEVRDKLIDEQIAKIKELAPEIPIIEV